MRILAEAEIDVKTMTVLVLLLVVCRKSGPRLHFWLVVAFIGGFPVQRTRLALRRRFGRSILVGGFRRLSLEKAEHAATARFLGLRRRLDLGADR